MPCSEICRPPFDFCKNNCPGMTSNLRDLFTGTVRESESSVNSFSDRFTAWKRLKNAGLENAKCEMIKCFKKSDFRRTEAGSSRRYGRYVIVP